MARRQKFAALAGVAVAAGSLLVSAAPVAVAASAESEAQWVQVAPQVDGANVEAGTMDASGCTWARGGGTICGQVLGKGKNIEDLHISRQKPGMICDYKGEWKVTNSAGKQIASGSSRQTNCTVAAAYFHWRLNKTYPTGTKVTLTWFREGKKDASVAFQLKK
ncbi:hypothetical protein [Streptomyces sp. CC210A]|uniref:hypothetical protein n=1 Tax=Streptomyces sp. CC210A TaxID=2898184 RepID=UPI001F446D03|nr:hypothetical protein [Streptomyces sp. CC210A]